MRARLTAMERTFAGKVLVISEFGAESNNLNAPGSPGSYVLPVTPPGRTRRRLPRPTRG